MKQKRKQTLIAAAVLLGIIFTGCSAPQSATGSPSAAAVEELTLFDTDTLEITLEGTQTRIQDKTSGNVYSFTTKKKYSTDPLTLEQMQARCIARTSADTATLKIEIAGGVLVVTDRVTGQTYFIQH